VKTSLSKSGNDQFFDMKNFDETSRRIRWSENEFSHSLALQPTPCWPSGSPGEPSVCNATAPAWLSFRLGAYACTLTLNAFGIGTDADAKNRNNKHRNQL